MAAAFENLTTKVLRSEKNRLQAARSPGEVTHLGQLGSEPVCDQPSNAVGLGDGGRSLDPAFNLNAQCPPRPAGAGVGVLHTLGLGGGGLGGGDGIAGSTPSSSRCAMSLLTSQPT